GRLVSAINVNNFEKSHDVTACAVADVTADAPPARLKSGVTRRGARVRAPTRDVVDGPRPAAGQQPAAPAALLPALQVQQRTSSGQRCHSVAGSRAGVREGRGQLCNWHEEEARGHFHGARRWPLRHRPPGPALLRRGPAGPRFPGLLPLRPGADGPDLQAAPAEVQPRRGEGHHEDALPGRQSRGPQRHHAGEPPGPAGERGGPEPDGLEEGRALQPVLQPSVPGGVPHAVRRRAEQQRLGRRPRVQGVPHLRPPPDQDGPDHAEFRGEEDGRWWGPAERLWRLLSLKGLSGESSPWLRQYRRHLLREGADGDAQTRAMLLQLWATQGNVGPAAFWLLAFLLTHPEAMAAVRREFGRAAQGGNRLEQQQPTPVFDSALEETLRLTAAPFITREVLQDKTLRMATGHEYRLRRGDRVCLFPLVSPQMDPEIYQEPEKFKYNRFLNSDGTPKREFYKGGQRLKYYTMPWGAGANGCVGKPFAINAIRQLVFLVVSRLDVEPCDPASGVPAMDPGRYGFGMVQPVGDLPIRYKVKSEESL
uniref:Prostacyclin synthase n=1 Tax=Denticeps clupeoides TaxID=299321 RepID=A0AAY4CN81_9TELE